MITFSVSLVCLLLGYLIYGAIVERVIKPNAATKMPCYTKQDGVDFLPMPAWRVFLIQFLNIAGTGPIFGAIMGIMFGPAAFLWIVLGCIFAGAVHDYLCGMICIRQGGVSLPEIIGNELGNGMRLVMRIGALVLLVLVGAVFVTTPASLLDNMTADNGWLFSKSFWISIIFLYFILATLLPIDKLIGRVYPVFGLALLLMAVGIGWGIYTQEGGVPEITDAPFVSHHPKGLPIFPMLCITIACGAISGFHGTQSPLMARCMTNERFGRPIFYGAMITEGVVALIWAAAAVKFADALPGEEGATAYEKLCSSMIDGEGKINPAILVKAISTSWMGTIGALLAVLGVVAAPITSGDTAFRSARLIVADFLHVSQKNIRKRLMLCLPLFIITTGLFFIDFEVLWRYFAWTNQTLATIMLWAAAVWLAKQRKFYWIAFLPALFMTVVCTSYILIAPEGFKLSLSVGLSAGFVLMILLAFLFGKFIIHKPNKL
ncbi:MAG: carbon starvation protein A [Bacteroidaceae bacterium]|nr:carbon starvation protein A [Bacteroidaceae bacterium]